MMRSSYGPTPEMTCTLGELCAHLVMRELLGHPPPELTSTLGEVFARLEMQGLLRSPYGPAWESAWYPGEASGEVRGKWLR